MRKIGIEKQTCSTLFIDYEMMTQLNNQGRIQVFYVYSIIKLSLYEKTVKL